MENYNHYRTDEIKYKIDTAIQLSMYHTNKSMWDVLLEAQGRLYEEFGIDD